MKDPGQVERFWSRYVKTLPPDHRAHRGAQPEAWSFGDTAHLADELADLVVQGVKTATCSRHLGEALPKVGELSILLDGAGRPQCVIKTLEVKVTRFCDVDAAFAADEGEGDRSLAHWRKAHWAFFSREGEREGYEVSEEMPLVCERFQVLFTSS